MWGGFFELGEVVLEGLVNFPRHFLSSVCLARKSLACVEQWRLGVFIAKKNMGSNRWSKIF